MSMATKRHERQMSKTIALTIAISLFVGQSCLAGCPDGQSQGLFGWCYPNIPRVGWPKAVMEIFPNCWGHPQDCDQETSTLPPPPPRGPQPGSPPHQPPNITYGDLYCAGPGDEPGARSYRPRTLACWFYPTEQVCTGIADGSGSPDNGAWLATGLTCPPPPGGNYALISSVTPTPAHLDQPGPGKQQFCYNCSSVDRSGNSRVLKPLTNIWAIDWSDGNRLSANICTGLADGRGWSGAFLTGACPPPPPPAGAADATPVQQPSVLFCFVCPTTRKFTEIQCSDASFNGCNVNLGVFAESCPPPPHQDLVLMDRHVGTCASERKQPGLVEAPIPH
jgi:hypothetical protein